MRTSACLLAGSLCLAAFFLAGCQHEVGGATDAAPKSSGSGARRPKKPEAKDKAKAKPVQPKPEVAPANKTEGPVTISRGEKKPEVASPGKTGLTVETPEAPMSARTDAAPAAAQEPGVTETGSDRSPRPKKSPPKAPAITLTDGSARTAEKAPGKASLSGIDPDGKADARRTPRVISVKPEAASSARVATAPAPLKSGEILPAGTTSGDTARRPTNLALTDDKPAPRSPGAAVALPAPAGEKPGRVERIAKPLNLTEWLADEKAHAEWLRRQQEKQAAANAARESERLRLKSARDRVILDENPAAPEKSPAQE